MNDISTFDKTEKHGAAAPPAPDTGPIGATQPTPEQVAALAVEQEARRVATEAARAAVRAAAQDAADAAKLAAETAAAAVPAREQAPPAPPAKPVAAPVQDQWHGGAPAQRA